MGKLGERFSKIYQDKKNARQQRGAGGNRNTGRAERTERSGYTQRAAETRSTITNGGGIRRTQGRGGVSKPYARRNEGQVSRPRQSSQGKGSRPSFAQNRANRGGNRDGNRMRRGRGGGGGSRKPLSKEELDRELAEYKGNEAEMLDQELEDYKKK